METEYIRGKLEERSGAASARPNATFSRRGNDVWAARSGRQYLDGGEEKSFAAPVLSGMGNLSRLVGGRRRRPRGGDIAIPPGGYEALRPYGSQYSHLTEGDLKKRWEGYSDEQRRNILDKGDVKAANQYAQSQRMESKYDPLTRTTTYTPGEARQQAFKEARGLELEHKTEAAQKYAKERQKEWEKAHPGWGLLNKLGRAVPGVSRTLAQFGEATHILSPVFAKGMEHLADTLEEGDSLEHRVAQQMEAKYPSGGSRGGNKQVSFSRMIGGAYPTLSPNEAKQLMMMDYRGGSHPYLTKTGKVRGHIKGSGIWDWVKSLADPNSTARTQGIPGLATVANLASPIINKYAPGVGTKIARAANTAAKANAAAKAAQHLYKGEYGKAAQSGVEGVAFHLANKAHDYGEQGHHEEMANQAEANRPRARSRAFSTGEPGLPEHFADTPAGNPTNQSVRRGKPLLAIKDSSISFKNRRTPGTAGYTDPTDTRALREINARARANARKAPNFTRNTGTIPLPGSSGIYLPQNDRDLISYDSNAYTGLGMPGEQLQTLQLLEGSGKATKKEKEALHMAHEANEMGMSLEEHLKHNKVPAAKRRTIMRRVNNAISKGEKGQAVSTRKATRQHKEGSRQSIVKQVMAERGLSLIDASRAVKAEGLY